jgi:competence protein ComEC
LDVGQGDGIFMKGPEGGTYLVDGGSSDVKKVGQYRLEPFLKSQGVGVLDYVLISHGDGDHRNGVEELIERQDIGVKIRTLVLPVQEAWDEALAGLAKKAKDYGIRVVVIEPGQNIREGEMAITCIQPGNLGIKSEKAGLRKENTVPETGSIIPVTEKLESGNEASMVLAVQYGVDYAKSERQFRVNGAAVPFPTAHQRRSLFIDFITLAHAYSVHSFQDGKNAFCQ